MTDENAGGPLAIMLESVVVLLVGGTAFSGDGDSTTVFGVLAVMGRRLRRGHDFSPSARMPRGAQSANGFVRSDRDCP